MQVWALPEATRARLDARLALRGRPAGERALVFLLRGLMEWCVYPPQVPSNAPSSSKAKNAQARNTAAEPGKGAKSSASTARGGEGEGEGDSSSRSSPGDARNMGHARNTAGQDGSSSGGHGSSGKGGASSSSSSSSGGGARLTASEGLVPWSCTEEALLALSRARDPLGLGLDGGMGLRLLQVRGTRVCSIRLMRYIYLIYIHVTRMLLHTECKWQVSECSVVRVRVPGWLDAEAA